MRFEVGSRDSTRRFGRCLLITLLLTPLTTRLSFTAPQAPAARDATAHLAELDRRAAAAMAASDYPQAHFALSQAYLRAHRKADADRERELFAKLKQRGLGPGAPPGAREYSGAPAENLPLRPEE